MNQKLFSRDFTLVVIGQIISLFGNAIIRFALPLYLLNLTGSSALYGTQFCFRPLGGLLRTGLTKEILW